MTVNTQASRLGRLSTIGCDYSSSALYLACVNGNKVNRIVTLQVPNPVTITFLQILSDTLIRFTFDFHPLDAKVWIEQPWVNGRFFPLSGLMLARTAAFVEAYAVRCHLKPELVHPKTWRKAIYGHGAPKDAKDLSVITVKERFGYDVPVMGKTGRGRTPDHNIAEAILIASYGNQRSEYVTGVEG